MGKKGKKKMSMILSKENLDGIRYDVHAKIVLEICTYFYFRYEIVSLLKKILKVFKKKKKIQIPQPLINIQNNNLKNNKNNKNEKKNKFIKK